MAAPKTIYKIEVTRIAADETGSGTVEFRLETVLSEQARANLITAIYAAATPTARQKRKGKPDAS